MAKNDYWFKRRRYGWGWVPVTWQGWLVVAIYVAILLAASLILMDEPEGEYPAETGIFLMVLVVATAQLIVIGYKKGPRPKWRWGKSPDDDPDKDF